MKVHIITIFPESFDSYFSTSIIAKAIDKKKFEPLFYKLNNYATTKTKRVDSKAYGMHGQVLSPKPLKNAIEAIFDSIGSKIPVVYMSPNGFLLKQESVEKYGEVLKEEFIIICGHYEGIDKRIIDLYVDYEISIGEYVLTSGEIAAQVFLDSMVRLIPGVLGNKLSWQEDSFSKKLNRQKEYPVYTRPENFMGKLVPKELLSGNPKLIENWKRNNLGK